MNISTEGLEMRLAKSSITAGIIEILMRPLTGVSFFGYLGIGMVLYGVAHIVYVKLERRRKG